MDNTSEKHQFLPLREATFFIMLSLAPGANHGYAIMKEVEKLSDGRVVLSTGTLYGAIKRLLERGWIERKESLEEDQSGRVRKAYALTDKGRSILNGDVSRMQKLIKIAQLNHIKEMS